MFISGKCKKCDAKVIFDIADKRREEVELIMKNSDFGECRVGFHVEIGKKADYYELNWNNTFETQAEAKVYNDSLLK